MLKIKIKLSIKLLTIIAIFTLSNCNTKQENIKFDNKNFAIVNTNYKFPVYNFSILPADYDSLGLTCKACLTDDLKQIYLHNQIIDKNQQKTYFRTLGWGASYHDTYNQAGRIIKTTVQSCFNWDISYTYLDTLNLVYQFSKIDSEPEIDTTIFILDNRGRIEQIDGIEYGDLCKRNYHKTICYTDTSSIPAFIQSTFNRDNRSFETRNETFFKTHNQIDSIQIEVAITTEMYKEKYLQINYFDKKGIFNGQKRIANNFPQIFYIERTKQ